MSAKRLVRRAAVLGAGVMGAQIAAHLTNAGVDTVLFDLPAKEGDPNGIVLKAAATLGKLSPAPLATKALSAAIVTANYEVGLQQLMDCALILETIAERDLKSAVQGPRGCVSGKTVGSGINKKTN